MKRPIILFAIALLFVSNVHSQTVIKLYPGKAPGSESWTWPEQNLGGYLKDITEPTLTAFVPKNPNGIAVIIAPGGGFHYLVYDIEGTAIAKSLNEKGITAFVLKYRLVHEDPAHPYYNEILQSGNLKKLDTVSAPVIKLELQDALTAVKYVREHAAEYKIDPNRIGFEGSSAGGTITMSVVYNATDENRPNFIAPVYAYGSAVIGSQVPSVRTPAFICAASDDELGLTPYSVEIYSKWLAAKQPAELHIYQKGGHGFGTKKQNLPVDSWLDRFIDWIFLNYPISK